MDIKAALKRMSVAQKHPLIEMGAIKVAMEPLQWDRNVDWFWMTLNSRIVAMLPNIIQCKAGENGIRFICEICSRLC